MDSFETILELLKQAQDRGRDAVAGKLETIAEKLGHLVDEATTSVREITSQEADELLPVADLRSALEDFHRRAAEEAEEKTQLARRLQEAEETDRRDRDERHWTFSRASAWPGQRTVAVRASP